MKEKARMERKKRGESREEERKRGEKRREERREEGGEGKEK